MTTPLDALLAETRARLDAAAPAPAAYWAEMTAGLARNLLADGAPPTRAALLAVAVCALAGAAAIEGERRLILLPGDLLGRVTGRAPDHGLACVERWAADGWHAFGVERCERLITEGVERHHDWAAAVGHVGDAPIV